MGGKKYLLAAFMLILMMLVPGVAYASTMVNEITSLPGDGWYTSKPYPGQSIPADAVQSELSYLNQSQIFDSITIDVDLYDQQVYRISEGVDVPYGGTSFDGNIYIFTGYWTSDGVSSAIVHEIGHMIRHRFITDAELQTYMAMRGVQNEVLDNGITNLYEELFAEDFRTLFGDAHAQVPQYDFYQTIPLPNAQDKEFILSCINGAAGGSSNSLVPAVAAPAGLL